MNTVKKHAAHGFTQFELTTQIVKSLSQFDLTPTSKLVLILLTTHYNEGKNGSVVFPSMPYISETLGISLTSTKQSIKDLINLGLIIKSKRGKVRGNYNKYLLMPAVCTSTAKEQKPVQEAPKAEKEVNQIKKVVSFTKSSNLAEIPDIIKNNKKILNPCSYWASLDEQAKNHYISKENEEKQQKARIEKKKKLEAEDKAKKEAENKAIQEELSKPLNERFTKEQAVKFVWNLRNCASVLNRGMSRDLINLYNLDVEIICGMTEDEIQKSQKSDL